MKPRLSSRCQLSVTLPSRTRRMSMAVKSIAWPLPCTSPSLPVKCPVRRTCDTTRSTATTCCSTVTTRSGTAARKPLDAAAGPAGPCGRPGGSAWSKNSGDSAFFSKSGLPLFQKPYRSAMGARMASRCAGVRSPATISSLRPRHHDGGGVVHPRRGTNKGHGRQHDDGGETDGAQRHGGLLVSARTMHQHTPARRRAGDTAPERRGRSRG